MLLLDTHAFVWLASDQSQLTETGRSCIREQAGALCVSSITGFEIALLHKRGRLTLPLDPEAFIRQTQEHHGVEELPVTAAIGCRAAGLPDIHNDPFDRLIVATCQAGGHTLLTKDLVIATYPDIVTIW